MKLGEIAAALGCELEGDPALEIERVAPIEDAGPGELTFVANERYLAKLAGTRATAVILGPDVRAGRAAILRTKNPYLAFVKALDLLHAKPRPQPFVHPTAVVAANARIGRGPSIGAYSVIGDGAVLGDDARIDAHVVLYPGVSIGDRFRAFSNVVVHEGVTIGNDVKLQSGAVVGGDGFGYTPDENGRVRAIPQVGTVILEDAVEIGANSTIDRATIGATRIRRGAKIDNLVQVAHGCEVGESAFLAAQVGLAGSSVIGAGSQLGGQVGIAGHLRIGRGVRIGAQAGVPNDVPDGAVVMGYPAIDMPLWRRVVAAWVRLPELLRRVRKIEKHLGLGKPGQP